MTYGVVYVITNTVNGKQYVGQTTAQNPIKYFRGRLSAANSSSDRGKDCRALFAAIQKYGRDAFNFRVLFVAFDKAALDAAEDHFIVEYKSISPRGYNLKRGGARGTHHATTKRKLSVANARVWVRADVRDAHRIATRLAMSRADVRERCGDAMRGRRWITNGTVSRVIARGEPLPEGWVFGRCEKATLGKTFATNGQDTIRIDKDAELPEGWSFGGHSAEGKFWITNGARNRRISEGDLIPEGWELGFSIRDEGHRANCGVVTAGSRWITNGVLSKRTFSEVLPDGWRFGRA